MYVHVDETLQLGLDCFAALSPRSGIVFGWAMTPRGEETGVSISAGHDGACAIEHSSFHPRPDVVPKDPGQAVVNGFCLIFGIPDDAAELTLHIRAGRQVLRADLRSGEVRGDLPKVTAERDWGTTFALFRSLAEDPTLAPMLDHGSRPFGAFGEWIARLATLRGRATEFVNLAEVEALATPAGEVLAMLRAGGPMPPEAEAEAVLVGWVRGEEEAQPTPVVLPMADCHCARLPGALAVYGRVDAAWVDRLASLEIVVQARLRGSEKIWLRAIPATVPAPDLLDAACRGTPGGGAVPGRDAAAGLGLLRRIIARREAAFGPVVAALSAAPVTTAGQPRLAVILGADDTAAARLFEVNAAALEQRCETLLVMGEAAEAVAGVFARRGRIEVLTGAEAMRALREAAGRASVLALDAVRHAEAIAEGRPEEAFPRRLEPFELTRLLALHAVAGAGRSLSDSLARLRKPRRAAPGEARFAPLSGGWSSRAAAELVNTHLARLWGAAPAPLPAEQPTHG